MRGLRLTKAERELVRALLTKYLAEGDVAKRLKVAAAVADKMDAAEMPVRRGTYLTVDDAIAAFREVLGQRLVAPRFEAIGVRSQMKNRIAALGLTRSDAVAVAKAAGVAWVGLIKAESLVRQAEVLLAGAQLELGTPTTNTHTPAELGDDEI